VNCPDGSVELAASGDLENLEELTRVVRQGPDGAAVTALDELAPVEDHDFPFAVRR
jgi:acylphosphatase